MADPGTTTDDDAAKLSDAESGNPSALAEEFSDERLASALAARKAAGHETRSKLQIERDSLAAELAAARGQLAAMQKAVDAVAVACEITDIPVTLSVAADFRLALGAQQ